MYVRDVSAHMHSLQHLKIQLRNETDRDKLSFGF